MEAPPVTSECICPKCGFIRQQTIIPGVYHKQCPVCEREAENQESPVTIDRKVNCQVAHMSMCEAIHRGNEWRKLRDKTTDANILTSIDEHIRMAEESVQKALQQLRDALATN